MPGRLFSVEVTCFLLHFTVFCCALQLPAGLSCIHQGSVPFSRFPLRGLAQLSRGAHAAFLKVWHTRCSCIPTSFFPSQLGSQGFAFFFWNKVFPLPPLNFRFSPRSVPHAVSRFSRNNLFPPPPSTACARILRTLREPSQTNARARSVRSRRTDVCVVPRHLTWFRKLHYFVQIPGISNQRGWAS